MDGDWSLLVCGTCMFEFWYQPVATLHLHTRGTWTYCLDECSTLNGSIYDGDGSVVIQMSFGFLPLNKLVRLEGVGRWPFFDRHL